MGGTLDDKRAVPVESIFYHRQKSIGFNEETVKRAKATQTPSAAQTRKDIGNVARISNPRGNRKDPLC